MNTRHDVPLSSFQGATCGQPLNRRRFLLRAAQAAAAAPFAAANWRLRGAPNSRLNHASIGVGGMGWNDLHQFLQHRRTQVVAICDVDAGHLERAAKDASAARTYRDWRELLAREGDRIDSVNLAVPDHMHYAIARSAINRGRHVYCQKPLCHDVAEVRALTEAARRAGVVTQLGTQMAAGVGDRTTVRWLRQGRIGRVQHIYMCANRPGAVENYRLPGPRPDHPSPPPASLAWDLWLGTAPSRPFAPGIYHPVKWRAWLDFGTGWSGDIGCHIFDAVWKGLEMQPPRWVSARVQASWQNSPARRADNWPQANWITWRFPGNRFSDGEDYTVEWVDGEFFPPDHIRKLYGIEDYPTESVMIVGSEGALLNPLGATPQLLPETRFADVRPPKLPALNHYHQFADACLEKGTTASHFAQTGPMTEAILLGTVAVRTPETRLEWDSRRLRIPNHPAAEQHLRRLYRAGWEMPGF